MSNILKLVLTDHWFEEIKSGRKTHEYRKATLFGADVLIFLGVFLILLSFRKRIGKTLNV